MRSPEKQKDRLQIPLMYAFRDAYDKHDADKIEDVRVDGERVVGERSSLRRRGTEEALLKQDLAIDVASLVDTIDLGSVVDLTQLTYVQKSILNYGLYDITHITLGDDDGEGIAENLKAALLHHEPRLSPETLVIERGEKDDEINQRIRYKVRADLICKPLDIPIEFVAELDTTSGKVMLPRVAGSA
jgi:type VI secretion system protein ImpF